MKNIFFIVIFTLSISLSPPVHATDSTTVQISDGELAQLLAPIALYPDTLLTHILIASTYPIEVIEAYRWVSSNEQLSTEQMLNRSSNKDWDPSVKALMPFPTILKRLHDDLTWTNQIGDAFLANEAQVLSSIQLLRQQADNAGNLTKMDNMEVNYDNGNIVIQPLQREIVYVPYYDSRTIYGNWYWNIYPPVYWAHPRHYISHRPYYWHTGVHISFNYFFSAFHWHSRHLVVVNHHNSRHYVKRHRIVSSHGAKRWNHQPHHRKGVAYSNNQVKKRFHSNRVSTAQSKKYRSSHQQLSAQSSNKKRYLTNKNRQNSKHQRTTKHLAQLKHDKYNKKFTAAHSSNKVKGTTSNKYSNKKQYANNSKQKSKYKNSAQHSANDKKRHYADKQSYKKQPSTKVKTRTKAQTKSNKQYVSNHKSTKSHQQKERKSHNKPSHSKHSKREKH
ncbi:MAG: DUF3300 domain-containing protein [Colwellia sp.]|nr:DUF3300 domain-containing protein [Colwellia sp.]